MTLKELLIKYNVSEDGIKEINQSVDALIESKAGTVKEQLATATSELTKVKEELEPFKAEARARKLTSLLPKNANKELANDIFALAGIADEDDDASITQKLTDTIKSRSFLQVQINEQPKITTKSIEEKPVKTEEVSIFD